MDKCKQLTSSRNPSTSTINYITSHFTWGVVTQQQKKKTTETSHKKVCQTQTSTCRDEILKNQPNKTGTTPQYFYTIPTSCAILPPVHNTKPSTFVLISPHQPQTNIVLHSIQLSHKITHPSQSITKLPLLTSQPPVYTRQLISIMLNRHKTWQHNAHSNITHTLTTPHSLHTFYTQLGPYLLHSVATTNNTTCCTS